MSNVRTRLHSIVWGQETGRIRAVWRVLVPVLVGFLALRLAGAAALGFDLNRGEMMLTSFAGTTLVMLAVLGVSARYLDRRPVREYGYTLSRNWWLNLGDTFAGSQNGRSMDGETKECQLPGGRPSPG